MENSALTSVIGLSSLAADNYFSLFLMVSLYSPIIIFHLPVVFDHRA